MRREGQKYIRDINQHSNCIERVSLRGSGLVCLLDSSGKA